MKKILYKKKNIFSKIAKYLLLSFLNVRICDKQHQIYTLQKYKV